VWFKTQPNKITYCGKKERNHKLAQPHSVNSACLLRDTQVKATVVGRLLLKPARKRCAGAGMYYSRQDCVFILEHYFVLKLFIAVRETFNIVYPDKEILNKIIIHGLVTKFWSTVFFTFFIQIMIFKLFLIRVLLLKTRRIIQPLMLHISFDVTQSSSVQPTRPVFAAVIQYRHYHNFTEL
jgi:hypothetical protein